MSTKVLQRIGVPESFGHYGLEDTFIVEAAKLLRAQAHPDTPRQYIMDNHIVGETYVHRCNAHMKQFVVSKNRKEEFRKVATQNFTQELMAFQHRIFT